MSECKCNGCIRVELKAEGLDYSHVRLREDPVYSGEREIYLVNAQALVKTHKTNKRLSLPDCIEWTVDTYEYIEGFLDPELDEMDIKHPLMPRIAVHKHEKNSVPSLFRRLFGDSPKTWVEYDIVFGNGRHRTYFLEHAGAELIPVQTSVESARLLEETIGKNNIQKYIKPSEKKKLLFHGSKVDFTDFDSACFNSGEGVSQYLAWYFIDNLKGALYHAERVLGAGKDGLVYVCKVPENIIIDDLEQGFTDGHYHGSTSGVSLFYSQHIEIVEVHKVESLYEETCGQVKYYELTNEKRALKGGCISFLKETTMKPWEL